MKFILSVLVVITLSLTTQAQSAELILMGGTSHYLGDLGGKDGISSNEFSDLDLNTTRYALGVGFRLRLSETFAMRINGMYTRVAGSDENTDREVRRDRNLSFFSPIIEGSIMGEIYFGSSRRFYVFGGIGNFYFNPKTKYNGKKYELQPLGTEGQNYLPNKNPYDLTSFSYPFGIGYKIPLNNGSVLGFELMMRKTNTDYIDDVSSFYADNAQITASGGAIAGVLADRSTSTIPGFSEEGAIRGDPKDNDNFSMFLVTYSMPLSKGPGLGFGGSKRKGGLRFKKGKCFQF
jgi:hypothetical protein